MIFLFFFYLLLISKFVFSVTFFMLINFFAIFFCLKLSHHVLHQSAYNYF